MARHKLTLEELKRAGERPCPEHLKDSLRQRLLDEMIWLKSTGPKSPEGKARSAANNSGRSAIWSVKCSGSAVIGIRAKTDEFIAGVAKALDDAGLPHHQIAWKTSYRINMRGQNRGAVQIFVKGKKAPFARYGEAVRTYCEGWLND
jgi:hypothetical protein